MRTGAIPFKFDLSDLLKRARSQAHRVGDITISLPFVSLSVSPKDRETQIAREIVIRLRDRRVLSAWECCDDCIDKALASMREIRQILVNKQVELSDAQDGPLYLLLDVMLVSIRQFMTYEELLRRSPDATPNPRFDKYRLPEHRDCYLSSLELLRGHLSRCLGQVAIIAGMDAPADGLIAHYQGPWDERAYLPATEATS